MTLINNVFTIGTCLINAFYSITNTDATYPIGSDKVQMECLYKVVFKPDSMETETQFDYYTLKIGGNISSYTSKKNASLDSLLNIYTALPFTQETAHEMTSKLRELPLPKSTFTIYKNRKATTIWFFDKISTTKYFYEEPASEFNWTIQPDRAVIAGFKCEKATMVFSGRKYEAWFTKDIPVSDGPHKFTGLPGLIVKIQDTGKNYVFELTKVVKPTALLIINPPAEANCVRTTKLQLRQGQRDYRQNGTKQMLSSGAIVIQGKSQQNGSSTARRINPLELR